MQNAHAAQPNDNKTNYLLLIIFIAAVLFSTVAISIIRLYPQETRFYSRLSEMYATTPKEDFGVSVEKNGDIYVFLSRQEKDKNPKYGCLFDSSGQPRIVLERFENSRSGPFLKTIDITHRVSLDVLNRCALLRPIAEDIRNRK